jgi:hypothetical protein
MSSLAPSLPLHIHTHSLWTLGTVVADHVHNRTTGHLQNSFSHLVTRISCPFACVFPLFALLLEGPGRRTEPDAKQSRRAVSIRVGYLPERQR